MAVLTVEQINPIVNQAYGISTGKTDFSPIDLTKMVDIGSLNLEEIREPFTKALIALVTKNWFTDTSYRTSYNDPFLVNEDEFGLITQLISATVPEVQENPAWTNFVSGVSKVGEYTVYLPVVDTRYYTKMNSWALPITISWTQWTPAMKNAEDLQSFVNYILMVVDNAILLHRENMNMANRNNYIGERLQQTDGVAVIDLVAEYQKAQQTPRAMTQAEALNDKELLRYAIERMWEIAEYFQKQTSKFNSAGKVRFTPKERLVLQILSAFDSRVAGSLLSDTFHDNLLTIPNYETVPFWEGIGDATFKDTSAIHVTTSSGAVETNGIVALMADKWSIMHTIKSERVGSQNFNIENVTLYSYQFTDQYLNDLTQNGVVFVIRDYTPPAQQSTKSK